MDETREIALEIRRRRERGDYEQGVEELNEAICGRARALRVFYEALLQEGFAPQDAVYLVAKVAI